jgi:hypothetical protein
MATETHPPLPADLPVAEIGALCRKHRVRELYLFGSALREDFRPDSDIDLLVVFEPDAERPWMGHFGELEADLSRLLNRPVDLVSRRAVEQSRNWIRRKAILDQAHLLYAA